MRIASVGHAVFAASMIGTIIEWYDFFVYGTAAALVFAPLFFSNASSTVGTLAAFTTYALGFAVRPIGGAVFGSDGQLLGTARAEQKVQRVWLGRTLQSSVTVTLDFGSSLDYADARTFQISISKRKVLTPDAWQKSEK